MPLLHPLVPWGKFTRIYEPFLGGGAFFFSLDRHDLPTVILSDANRDLMRFYEAVATSAAAVAVNAIAFSSKHSPKSYLRARALFNALKAHDGAPTRAMDELHAGLFLYLNKCGFNGLFRVNEEGHFNVAPNPNSKWNPTTLELCNQLYPAQTALRRVTRLYGNFSEVFAVHPPRKDDFIFCDPPYVPPRGSDGFTRYTDKGFAEEDLVSLRAHLAEASLNGAQFMVTHTDTPFVRELFEGCLITEYTARRSISRDGGNRQSVKELCIRNYG